MFELLFFFFCFYTIEAKYNSKAYFIIHSNILYHENVQWRFHQFVAYLAYMLYCIASLTSRGKTQMVENLRISTCLQNNRLKMVFIKAKIIKFLLPGLIHHSYSFSNSFSFLSIPYLNDSSISYIQEQFQDIKCFLLEQKQCLITCVKLIPRLFRNKKLLLIIFS